MNAISAAWRDVDAVAAATRELVESLRTLDDATTARPSLLPDWTVGHVLSHIARNCDSHTHMLQGAMIGETRDQYPGGAAQRSADIAAGAARPAVELVDDVEASGQRLAAAYAAMTDDAWQVICRRITGADPAYELPFLRLREVVVHHADLGLGYSWADWPRHYIRNEIRLMSMAYASRKPMGMTTLPEQVVAADEPLRCAWLVGRADIEPLPRFNPFG
jgi:maleylpyruvate isomerase